MLHSVDISDDDQALLVECTLSGDWIAFYEQDRSKMCRQKATYKRPVGFICTRTLGHSGPHVALYSEDSEQENPCCPPWS
jgi:hypothetical protein